MNTTRMTGTIQTATISFLLAAAVVFLLGEVIPNEASAFKAKAKGVSISKRVQGQSDLCWAGGGTTTVSSSGVFHGITTTTCNGGKQDGMKCTNTKNSTTCNMPRTVLLEDSKLAEALASSSLGSLEPVTAPEDDTSRIDQGVVTEEAPIAAPEPTATPEDDTKGTDQVAVAEEAPLVAPEPTRMPEDSTVVDDGAVTDEPLTVDPGTEGEATSGAKNVNVDVALGDGSTLPALEVDEQQ